MSKSLFDRARLLTKRLFSSKKNTPRPRKVLKTPLSLEALEERTLLSTSGAESVVQTSWAEAGRYVVQEAVNYISSVESAVATVQQMIVNLEQQALLTVSRMESMVVLTVEQFIRQTLLPSSTHNGPSVQPSSIDPTQSGVESLIPQNSTTSSGYEPITPPTSRVLPIVEGSLAGGTAPPTGAFTPSQVSQAYGFNQITFDNDTVKGDGNGQTHCHR
jgi:hypothetical protein